MYNFNNFNEAHNRINDLQATADRDRQVREAKKAGKEAASEKPKFGLFFRRTARPAELSPERRAELIQQEWKA
jgi:hypothetical protein